MPSKISDFQGGVQYLQSCRRIARAGKGRKVSGKTHDIPTKGIAPITMAMMTSQQTTRTAMTPVLTVDLLENEEGANRVDWKIHDSGKRPIKAPDIENLVRLLADVRSKMTPPVAEDGPMGESMQAMMDPRWWLTYDPAFNGAMLMVRHAGFGWIGQALPLESLRTLYENMGNILAAAEAAAVVPPKSTLN